MPAGSWHRLPRWKRGLCMRWVVSCRSSSFPWLVVFFGALLRKSMIHKHTERWLWQGSTLVVSWNWENCSCRSKRSMLLSSGLFWRDFQAWNPFPNHHPPPPAPAHLPAPLSMEHYDESVPGRKEKQKKKKKRWNKLGQKTISHKITSATFVWLLCAVFAAVDVSKGRFLRQKLQQNGNQPGFHLSAA